MTCRSMSEEIKIIAFRFFRSKELDGKYYSRTGTAKLKIIDDGWQNLRYLFDYKKKIKCIRSYSVSRPDQ